MSSQPPTDLPTLTEVVDVLRRANDAPPPLPPAGEAMALEDAGTAPAPAPAQPLEPMLRDPVAFDSLPAPTPTIPMPAAARAAGVAPPPLAYDEELVAQVMVRLQPRLEGWVEAQVRQALMEMLPVWTESAALSIVRELRSQMPELLSIALDEVHRQRHGG